MRKFGTTQRTIAIALLSAAVGAGAASVFAAEKQPFMEAAMKSLKEAEANLKKATNDKGGHKDKALDHIKEAIKEVQKGIDYDEKRKD